MGLAIPFKRSRSSAVHGESSPHNSSTRTGPATNIVKRKVFAPVWALFATPYQSSYSDTDATHTCSPDSTAFENRLRTGSDVRLISAIHAFVSSKYPIADVSVKNLPARRRRLCPAPLP